MLTLHEGRTSSASWRVRWGLALKRIPYRSAVVDIAGGEHLTALAALNPMRQVPTLELDDGRVLTESVAILEWLDETHPDPPLLPADPFERARVRALVQLVNAGIHPLQNTQVRKAISDDAEAQRAWAARWIERGLRALEEHVAGSGGRFAVGDEVTMADLYLAPQVRNAYRFGADVGGCPRVIAVYEECMETPEAQATAPV
jgi:maleylacetoacetate isomerase/maleylpyruvate isomerase